MSSNPERKAGSALATTGLISLLVVLAAGGGVYSLLLSFYSDSCFRGACVTVLSTVILGSLIVQASCLLAGIIFVVRRRPSWWIGGYVGCLLLIPLMPFIGDSIYRSIDFSVDIPTLPSTAFIDESAAPAFPDHGIIPDVTVGKPGWAIAGGWDGLWVSQDGVAWHGTDEGALGEYAYVEAIAPWGTGFVAGGSSLRSAEIWTTTNGHSWDRLEGPFDGTLLDMEEWQGSVIAVTLDADYQPGILLIAADKTQQLSRSPEDATYIQAVTTFDDRLYLAGVGAERGMVWVSTDGHSWSPTIRDDLTDANFLDIAIGPGGLIAVGLQGRSPIAVVSANGQDWETMTEGLPPIGKLAGVAASQDLIVAVGRQENEAGNDETLILFSEDGRTWSPAEIRGEIGEGGALLSVATASDRWLAVGDFGLAFESTDGRVWSEIYPLNPS